MRIYISLLFHQYAITQFKQYIFAFHENKTQKINFTFKNDNFGFSQLEYNSCPYCETSI